MTINGVDLDFNLYDAENTEMQKRYEAELLKMQNIAAEQDQIQGAAETDTLSVPENQDDV